MNFNYCTKKNIKIFLGIGLVMTVLCAIMDIWSIYLEAHMEFLRKFSNNLETIIKPEPISRGIVAAHTVLSSFQSGVLGSLILSTSRENNFSRDLNVFLSMLCLEYGLFLGYMILTWNHYIYPFITACFLSLAYKSLICTPLIDFREGLRSPNAETSENNNAINTHSSNITLWCTRRNPE